MRSLLLTPTYFPQLTGNAVTVHRIFTGLLQAGYECRIVDLSRTAGIDLLDIADDFSPHIIHSFHAYKAGRAGVILKKMLRVPLLTTMTGTDINIDLRDRERGRVIKEVLAASDLVTVFNDSARSVLVKKRIPGEKMRIIHQSVLLEEKRTVDYRQVHGIDEKDTVFLLLGGIRRVKRIGYAIDVLGRIKKIRPAVRLFIAGPVLEQEEYRRIAMDIRRLPWVTYLGPVSRENIPSLLKNVDIVLNTSASESEANSILEAFYFGKQVIARNIPGNSSLLSDRTGFLFRNKKEFHEKILYVIDHPEAHAEVKQESDRLMKTVFSREHEKTAYASVYEALVVCRT